MTATEQKLKQLVNLTMDQIANGRLDKYLEAIMAECNERRRVVRDQLMRKNARELNVPGTKVRLITIRPAYLVGTEGVVVPKPPGWVGRKREKPGTIYVDIGRVVRNRYGPVLGCPASCLEAV